MNTFNAGDLIVLTHEGGERWGIRVVVRQNNIGVHHRAHSEGSGLHGGAYTDAVDCALWRDTSKPKPQLGSLEYLNALNEMQDD